MKFGFYIFTGTGNTLRVCKRLAEELRLLGHEAELHLLRADRALPPPAAYDVFVAAYPVHAFNAPAPLLKFLKSLPKGKKGERKPAYLVRTSGEPLALNHASGILPARILRRRGYDVTGEFSFVMPYNIIFRHSDGMAARMWRAEELTVASDALTMASGGGERKKINPFRRFVSFVLRIEHTAMPLLGRRFRAQEACVGCGACVKLCPQGNISMKNGKPVFGKSCAGCMGCAFGCPQDAIRISLLNGWRVNGAYRFDGAPASDREVCDYCKRAYLRYFHRAESGGETQISRSQTEKA